MRHHVDIGDRLPRRRDKLPEDQLRRRLVNVPKVTQWPCRPGKNPGPIATPAHLGRADAHVEKGTRGRYRCVWAVPICESYIVGPKGSDAEAAGSLPPRKKRQALASWWNGAFQGASACSRSCRWLVWRYVPGFICRSPECQPRSKNI
jgi:hypothetical protein